MGNPPDNPCTGNAEIWAKTEREKTRGFQSARPRERQRYSCSFGLVLFAHVEIALCSALEDVARGVQTSLRSRRALNERWEMEGGQAVEAERKENENRFVYVREPV